MYGDVFSYLLWPDDDYDPFWSYGPDFFLSGIFWPGPYSPDWSNRQYDGLYDVYGASPATAARTPATARQTTSATSAMTATCSGLAPDVTDLPIDRIRRAVRPTGDQAKALDDLKSAAAGASDVVKASCPSQVALTPPQRLDVVEKRLDAMVQAVQIVRAPLDSFYGSLSDAQKKRLAARCRRRARRRRRQRRSTGSTRWRCGSTACFRPPSPCVRRWAPSTSR